MTQKANRCWMAYNGWCVDVWEAMLGGKPESTGRLMQVEGAQTLKRQVLLSRTSGDGIVVEKQV